jgi:copper(I)-binding protein
MTQVIQRRRLLHAACAAGLSALLPAARACEYFTTTLRITHPWTRASDADADSALISMKFDEVTHSDRLIAVSTPVAESAALGGRLAAAEMNFLIPAGRETQLSEIGTFIRLSGLKHPLEMGRSYPLTLVFEHGGSVAASLSVDYESRNG